MIWREIDNFSSGSVCLALASEPYDEKDYFRNTANSFAPKGGQRIESAFSGFQAPTKNSKQNWTTHFRFALGLVHSGPRGGGV